MNLLKLIFQLTFFSSVPCLHKDTGNRLDGHITEKEVFLKEVLQEMKNNNSLGNDGFTAKFFKFFGLYLNFFLLLVQ